jgi:Xaa-Pro aminopeptidase
MARVDTPRFHHERGREGSPRKLEGTSQEAARPRTPGRADYNRHMLLATAPRQALSSRRHKLTEALRGGAALFVAGQARPRNYAANAHPFRPDSHFLYFFGWGAPGAMGLVSPGGSTLYLPDDEPDAALWSGPQPRLDEVAQALGVAVEPLDALSVALTRLAGGVATLPAVDPAARAAQAGRLGRPVVPRQLDGADATLADAVIALRLQHDEAAQVELRRAAEVTAAAHAAGMRATRAGLRESVVRAAMEAELTARGCATAYGSIVTVHGEILHNETHANLLEPEDLLLADVGAESPGGWAGDVTRTWPVSGRYAPEQAEIYDVVLDAQRAAIAAVRPGARYRDIHLGAMEAIARGLGALGVLRGDPAERAHDGTVALFFPHGVGHLLGLDVHDMEDLGDRAGYAPGRARGGEPGLRYLRLDRDLTAGMAVTIEPGVYFVPAILDNPQTRRGFGDRVDFAKVEKYRRLRGIRVEDDVLVTGAGNEVLTVAIPKTRNDIETFLLRRS